MVMVLQNKETHIKETDVSLKNIKKDKLKCEYKKKTGVMPYQRTLQVFLSLKGGDKCRHTHVIGRRSIDFRYFLEKQPQYGKNERVLHVNNVNKFFASLEQMQI